MRKFLSLLVVSLFSYIFLSHFYTLVFSATCTFTTINQIAPNGPIEVTVTGTSGAGYIVRILDSSGNILDTAEESIPPGQSSTIIPITAPSATDTYTIEVDELVFVGDPSCSPVGDNTVTVDPNFSSVSDPEKPAEIGAIVTVIKNIIGLLVPIAAIAFFIMMIVGGARFLLSGGDPKAVAGARSTLTFAIIGVILVIVSWLILLVIENVTGVGVTNVIFPTL